MDIQKIVNDCAPGWLKQQHYNRQKKGGLNLVGFRDLKIKMMVKCLVSRYEIQNRYRFESSVAITVENFTQINFLRKREMKSSSEDTQLYTPPVFLHCILSFDFLIFSQLILSSSQYNIISVMPRIKSHIPCMLLES